MKKTGGFKAKGGRTGRLYVVGIGPGSAKGMTGEARQALERCQVIAGYTVYADLVRDEFPPKGVSDHSHDKRRGALPHGNRLLP